MKYIWILLGFISLFLGTIGIVLPILPTVPFIWQQYTVLQKVRKRCITGLCIQNSIRSILIALLKTDP